MRRFAIPLLMTVVFLFPGSSVHGQNTFLNLGMTRTSLDLHDRSGSPANFAPGPRFTIGVTRDFPFSERLSLRIGTRFAQAGGRLEFESHGSGALEVDYLEMSAFGVARLPLTGDRLSAFLLTGPVLTAGLTCRLADRSGPWGAGPESGEGCYEAAGLRRSLIGVGWAAGGGLRLRVFGRVHLTVGLRYTLGPTGTPGWAIVAG